MMTEITTDFRNNLACMKWGALCQKQVSRAGTSNYIPQYLWDVVTSPSPWYLLLAQPSWIVTRFPVTYQRTCHQYHVETSAIWLQSCKRQIQLHFIIPPKLIPSRGTVDNESALIQVMKKGTISITRHCFGFQKCRLRWAVMFTQASVR